MPEGLNGLLGAKEERYASFLFIGDDDLLEILGQAKNPKVIQSHLKKLFQGIHKVQFNDDSATQITTMVNSTGKVVPLQDQCR